jgi:3-oxoacyl-(acyl-carrier-protein) synthase
MGPAIAPQEGNVMASRDVVITGLGVVSAYGTDSQVFCDSFAQFALAATAQALDMAGLKSLDALRAALVVGTAMGGTRSMQSGPRRGLSRAALPMSRSVVQVSGRTSKSISGPRCTRTGRASAW